MLCLLRGVASGASAPAIGPGGRGDWKLTRGRASATVLESSACPLAPTTTLRDPRNDEILIWVDGELKPRAEAWSRSSTPGFVLGDGVWEGLRIHHGHPAFLEQHLDRLFEGAAALMIDIGISRDELTRAVYDTLDGQRDDRRRPRAADGHPRGEVDALPGPRVTVGPATVVIIAEHKDPTPATVDRG